MKLIKNISKSVAVIFLFWIVYLIYILVQNIYF